MALSSLRRSLCWPCRLDEDHAKTVSELTVKRYESELHDFVEWLLKENRNPHTASQLDALIVCYKNDCCLSKFHLNYLIGALEFFIPSLKRQLNWAHRVALGKVAASDIKHSNPLMSKTALFFGAKLAHVGKPRMGLCIALQQATGMRPSEILRLFPEHVLRPEFAEGLYVFRLGANVGTKVKREQIASMDPSKHEQVACVLAQALKETPQGVKLFPFSYTRYRIALAGLSESLNCGVKYTPHGARAGFASEAIATGVPPQTVKDMGRWVSDTSFKTYIDIIQAAHVTTLVKIAGWHEPMMYASLHFQHYFVSCCFLQPDLHASSGVFEESHERQVRAPGIHQASVRGRSPLQHSRSERQEGKGRGSKGSRARSSSRSAALASLAAADGPRPSGKGKGPRAAAGHFGRQSRGKQGGKA